MNQELSGLSGGKKQKWLTDHNQMVLDYYRQFGAVATRQQFNLEPGTLDRILARNKVKEQKSEEYTWQEKALNRIEVAEAGFRELKHEVSNLKGNYGQFVELVGHQLAKKFFTPLLRHNLELPEGFAERKDPLAIGDLGATRNEK